MDPTLFRVDWEVLAEVLGIVIVLSFFVERALSLIFEHRGFVTNFGEKGLKTPIAFGVALFVVSYWDFDALAIIFKSESNSWLGYTLTAAIVAGGSKASIALFHDLMNARSAVLKKMDEGGATKKTKKKKTRKKQG